MTMNERVEQAARKYGCDAYIEYCRQHGVDAATTKYPSLENAFITGAEWMLRNQWISVDEELPPIDEKDKQYSIDVIVRCHDKTSIYNDYAYYDFVNETWCSLTRNCSFGPVTHWMSIPTLEGGEKWTNTQQ